MSMNKYYCIKQYTESYTSFTIKCGIVDYSAMFLDGRVYMGVLDITDSGSYYMVNTTDISVDESDMGKLGEEYHTASFTTEEFSKHFITIQESRKRKIETFLENN